MTGANKHTGPQGLGDRSPGAGLERGLSGPFPPAESDCSGADILRTPLRRTGLALETAGFPPITLPPRIILPSLISESLCDVQALDLIALLSLYVSIHHLGEAHPE